MIVTIRSDTKFKELYIYLNFVKFAFLSFGFRASTVCKQWRAISQDKSLYQKVDLSYGWIKQTPAYLTCLVKRYMARTKYLNLSGWPNLSLSSFQVSFLVCFFWTHCFFFERERTLVARRV